MIYVTHKNICSLGGRCNKNQCYIAKSKGSKITTKTTNKKNKTHMYTKMKGARFELEKVALIH
jgi:hypothetical protein